MNPLPLTPKVNRKDKTQYLGKINLIDLAGSENVNKSGVQGTPGGQNTVENGRIPKVMGRKNGGVFLFWLGAVVFCFAFLVKDGFPRAWVDPKIRMVARQMQFVCLFVWLFVCLFVRSRCPLGFFRACESMRRSRDARGKIAGKNSEKMKVRCSSTYLLGTCLRTYTFPETNISPKNSWSEDAIAFKNGPFSSDMLVFGDVMLLFQFSR